jgi:hypothetical protein
VSALSFWEITHSQDEWFPTIKSESSSIQEDLPVQDKVPEIKVSIPDTKPVTLMPNIQSPVPGYRSQRQVGRGAFQNAEYNLTEIGRITDTDAYVRQAFGKKTALMFKEGWDLVGKNPRTIKYVKTRFAQISKATSIPTNTLFRKIGSNIICKSNAFLTKVRKTEASGGKIRSLPSKTAKLKPVAGYFSLPAESMKFQLSGNNIKKWKQQMPDGDEKEYLPIDVIHITLDQKDGFIFGTPTITPVIDDIRALRKIEENIELLIYQHLFPLFQYKVGTETSPAGMTEAGEREIDVVKREIMYMPTEGGIVTPERHEIKAIGAEGRALRAESYLDHFKKRVFSGLGISAVDMGEGETSNRACYSEDTQTLTDSGFKYYWEITSEDKIATFNPETGEIEFHLPDGNILLYKHEGKMINFVNRNVNVLVTPDHDMWVGQPTFSNGLKWEKIHAEDIDQFQFKFRTGNLGWTGIDPEDFLLPYVPYKCYSEVPNPGPFSRINIHDWLEFLGYYVSEGCLAKSKGRWAVTVSQNERVNPIKTERIRQCLNRLPFKYNEYLDPKDQTVRFWINCKSLYLYLQENCGDYSYLKHLPSEVLEYKQNYLDTLFDALMLGDGTIDKREGRTSRTYYSNSELLLDQVQEIVLKLGYRAHILPGSRCGRICISENEVSNITKDFVSEIDYSGMVYCFNVPNHLFITRRNGRIGIHGNTADNMSRNLVDGVKDLQQVLEDAINHQIIEELLLESTFGQDVLDEDNVVRIKFKEIDVDAQIKKETHAADQFNKDIIDHDEARRRMGLEPWIIPSPDEVQSEMDTSESYPQWHKSRWKMYKLPQLLIQALDEPWSPEAKAAAGDNSLPMTEKGNEESAKTQIAQEIKLEREKAKAKAEVAKTKSASNDTIKKQDGFLQNTYEQIKKDVVSRVSQKKDIDHDWIASLIRTQMGTSIKRLQIDQLTAFRQGYSFQAPVETQHFTLSVFNARLQFQERTEHYIIKLTENIISSLRRNVHSGTEDIILKTRAVFDALEYRTSFIENVEVGKAQNLGIATGIRNSTTKVTVASYMTNDNACPTCQSRNAQILDLNALLLDHLPPHHAGCQCSLQQTEVVTPIQDTVDKSIKKISAVSDKIKDNTLTGKQSKQYKFAKCKMKAATKLRERHPDWPEDEIQAQAEEICFRHLID